jgi:hypothetical protein
MMMGKFALACAGLVLAGCTTVLSDKPVFPPAMAANKSALEGTYTLRGDNGENVVTVKRRDASTYDAIGFGVKPAYREGLAMEFSAVPLGGGDYALQISCLASRDDNGTWKHESESAYVYWVLAASRAKGDYFVGWDVADADRDALSLKYHQQADKGTLKLSGLSPERAKAFFFDWEQSQLATGGDRVVPVLKALDWDAPKDAPEYDHAIACRDVPPG